MCAKYTTLDNAVNCSKKLVYNWLNLGEQRGKFTRDPPAHMRNCPYCAQLEDFQHLLSCADPRARKVQYNAKIKLRKAISGAPAASALLCAVKQWIAQPSHVLKVAPGWWGAHLCTASSFCGDYTTSNWVDELLPRLS